MKKILGIALVVIMVIAIGGYFYPKFTSQTPKVGISTSVDSGDCTFVNNGGVEFAYCSKALAATSSVLASFKNPWFGNASSTLVSYTGHGTTTPTAAGGMDDQLVDLATSTTQYGTSSPAFLKEAPIEQVTSWANWGLVWLPQATTTNTRLIGNEPTGAKGFSNIIIGRSEYLNLRVSTTSTSGTFTTYETGRVQAVFMKI